MIELSMHILDIVENSTRAGATLVTILITEDRRKDTLTIEIADNGEGMDRETVEKALDPFYTTKKVRRIGLGLPMLRQAAKLSDGHFSIESKRGEGTKVKAEFRYSHIDRQPLGDITGTIITMLAGTPHVDFEFTYLRDGRAYTLNTREIRRELQDIAITNPNVLSLIKENIIEGLEDIGVGA